MAFNFLRRVGNVVSGLLTANRNPESPPRIQVHTNECNEDTDASRPQLDDTEPLEYPRDLREALDMSMIERYPANLNDQWICGLTEADEVQAQSYIEPEDNLHYERVVKEGDRLTAECTVAKTRPGLRQCQLCWELIDTMSAHKMLVHMGKHDRDALRWQCGYVVKPKTTAMISQGNRNDVNHDTTMDFLNAMTSQGLMDLEQTAIDIDTRVEATLINLVEEETCDIRNMSEHKICQHTKTVHGSASKPVDRRIGNRQAIEALWMSLTKRCFPSRMAVMKDYIGGLNRPKATRKLKVQPKGRQIVRCILCSHPVPSQRVALFEHTMRHMNRKAYSCSECPAEFSSRQLGIGHLKNYHDARGTLKETMDNELMVQWRKIGRECFPGEYHKIDRAVDRAHHTLRLHDIGVAGGLGW